MNNSRCFKYMSCIFSKCFDCLIFEYKFTIRKAMPTQLAATAERNMITLDQFPWDSALSICWYFDIAYVMFCSYSSSFSDSFFIPFSILRRTFRMVSVFTFFDAISHAGVPTVEISSCTDVYVFSGIVDRTLGSFRFRCSFDGKDADTGTSIRESFLPLLLKFFLWKNIYKM